MVSVVVSVVVLAGVFAVLRDFGDVIERCIGPWVAIPPCCDGGCLWEGAAKEVVSCVAGVD